MSLLTIRAHQRFCVRHPISVVTADYRTIPGLLVELSLQGCRVGDVQTAEISMDDILTVLIADQQSFRGTVRWCGDRVVGMRLENAFHTYELDHLIRECRAAFSAISTRVA